MRVSRTSHVYNLTLTANKVDIWRINLAAQGEETQQCRDLLSQDEIQRADRFHFAKHRRRFTVTRVAMRQILGRYAGVPPQKLVFSYGGKGKPELSGALTGLEIKFNLSHSSEMALLAITQRLAVGSDIEWVSAEVATEEIAERFFSASEVNVLRALPAAERTEAFFSCWTRKEAYIKALGEGLSVPLDSFAVAFGPGVPAALLYVAVDPEQVSRWSIYDIEVPEGYKAALVVEGKGHHLLQWEWPQPHSG